MVELLDVLLRGFGLGAQSVAVGGILFIVVVLQPRRPEAVDRSLVVGRSLALVAAAAVGVALAQVLGVVVRLAALAGGREWPVEPFLDTTYFRASAVRLLAGLGLAVGCLVLRQQRAGRGAWVALMGLVTTLVVSSGWMSHAAGRLAHRAALLSLDSLHQFAAGAWLGGLAHLLITALRPGELGRAELQRFSWLSLGAVAILIAAGAGLSVAYIDSVPALLGTAYGVMVLIKGAMLAGLLVLGAANFLAVRRLPEGSVIPTVRFRRFVEVEAGLGATALFAAASLTTLPPAIDVVTDRATPAEVIMRFAPAWPRLSSPALADMPVGDRLAPRTAEDRAWSEYNHNVAGAFVLAMGCLAILHRARRGQWARHWPLLFLGLAGFLLLRSDPGAWPLGPLGFWESLAYPEVLQHRVFVVLVIVFGLFEWMVRAERLRSRQCALTFPLLCAAGGGLLITHGHGMLDLKAEFLTEVSHAPLGLLGILVGWGRWLELRLPAPGDRLPGWLSSVGLALTGALLLFYQEP